MNFFGKKKKGGSDEIGKSPIIDVLLKFDIVKFERDKSRLLLFLVLMR